jgi:hypothetical protein
MRTQKFKDHCAAIDKLMKRLALLASALDEDCAKVTLTTGPFIRIRKNLLEAFGTVEAIRSAHMPHVDEEDPPTAFVMTLALQRLIERVSLMAKLVSDVEKTRSRAKYLPRVVRDNQAALG